MPVLIGKGRRLTLAELYAVSDGDSPVEWHTAAATSEETPNDDPTDALTAQLAELALASSSSKNDTTADSMSVSDVASDQTAVDLMTPAETRAFLVLFAQTVAQGRSVTSSSKDEDNAPEESAGNPEDLAPFLVSVLKAIQKQPDLQALRLPTDPDVCQGILQELHPAVGSIAGIAVDRAMELARLGRAVSEAVALTLPALCVAALSTDVSGQSKVLCESAFSEFSLDVLRPHRSMIQAGALLRAFLNESRYVATDAFDKDDPACQRQATSLQDLPQYHGPAVEDIKAAYKRLELEINSQATDPDLSLDTTAFRLSEQAAKSAVRLLTRESHARRRCPIEEDDVEVLEDLTGWVARLHESLLQEAQAAVALIEAETAKAAEQAKEKTSTGGASNPNAPAKEDEFAGMSEAQKAKILKKRAEKEAKAEAKRKAKEQKGVSLFGTGTTEMVRIVANVTSLTDPTFGNQLSALHDKLLSGGVQRKPKIPKGTRDYLPEQMMIRQQAFSIIRRVFESHGAVEIDTPVFELKDTLTGKYGEDSKLIYDLADQGGELLALRYDLTVPFARFLSLNKVGNIKRFHIGKVYRRDQPALKRGRYREFYQCDFDIAGTYGRMVPDSECLAVACDILDSLPIGDFGIKLNHRRLLDAILDLCGVPAEKFRTICSAVDKLDKEPWEEVKREMVQDKGLLEEVADKIGTFVLRKGTPWVMYNELMEGKQFGDHEGALAAMEDLRILFEYLEAMDKLKFISFDLSLARGLDYYTGVIYEAVCMNGNTQVGSIGGGGRYDNLVSMFQEAGKETPCVGVSVGIERVFTLMEERLREEQGGSIKQPNVNVLVASAGGGMMKEKMKLTRMLWDAKISSEFSQQENAKLKKELTNALDREIPFMVIVGEQELKENKCKVKDLKAKTEDDVLIPELVAFLRKKGVIPVGCEFAAELLAAES